MRGARDTKVNVDTENRLRAVGGGRPGGWVEKVKGLSKRKIIDTDNSMVITRGEGEWGR